MVLIVIVAVAVAGLLLGVSFVVIRLDWQRDHPTLEQRRQRLLNQYASTDMDVEEYQRRLGKLEAEAKEIE